MAVRLRPEAAEPQGAHEGGGASASWWGEEGTRAAVYGVEADLGPRPKSRGGLPKPVTPPQPRLSTGRRATPGVSPPSARGKAGYRSPYKAPAVAPRPAGGSPKRAGTSAVPSRASSSRVSAAQKRVATAPPRAAGAASSSGVSARTSARAEPDGHEDEYGYGRVEPWEAEYDEQSDEPWELQGEAWEDAHGPREEAGTGGEAEEVGRRAGGGVGVFSNLQNMAEQHPDLLQALLGMHRDPEGRISGDTLRQVEAALREEGPQPPSRGSWRGPPPVKSPREGPSLRCAPAVGKSRVEVREETEAEAAEANAAKAIQARVRGNLSRKKTRALRSKTGAKAPAPRSPKRAGSGTPVKKESALKQSPVKVNKKKKAAAQPLTPPRSQASGRVMEALAQDLYTELMNKAAAKIQVAWKKKRRGRKGGFVQREVKIWERRESKQHKDSREASVKKMGSPSRPRPHSSLAREDLLADVPSSNGVPAPRLGPTKKLALEALEKGSKPAQIFVHLERSTKDGMSVASHVLKFHARANQGGIRNRELCDIVPEILPTGSAAQVGFVQAMLRAHGGDVASMPELRAILKDCRQAAAAGERLLQRPTAATTTLEDFTEQLNSDLKLAQRHFSEIDDNSDGKLTLPQVAQLFMKVRDYSSSTEVQILVTYLFRMFGMQTPTYTFGGLCKAMSLFQAKSKLSPEKKNPGVLHRIGPIPVADLRAELGATQEQSHGDFLASSGAASSAGITALTADEVSRPLLGPTLNQLEEAAPLHPAYHVRTEGKSQMLQHWTEKVHADRENKKHAAIRKEERRKVESMTLRDLYRSLPNNSNLKRSIAATRLGHAAQIMRIMREGRADQALYSRVHMQAQAQAQAQAQVQVQAQTAGLTWPSGPGAVPDLARPIGAEVLQQTVPAAASSPDRVGVQLQPALSYHAVAGGAQPAPLLSEANWAASPTDIRNAAGAVVSELEATLSKYLHFVEGQGSGSPGTAAEAVGVAALGGTVVAASAPRVTDLPATSPRRPEQPSPEDCPAAGPIEGGWSGFGLKAPPAPPLPSREAGGLPLDLPVPGGTGFAPLLPSATVSHPPRAEDFQFYAEAEYQPAAALPLSDNGWTNLQQPSPPAFAEARPAGPLQVYPRYYPAPPPAAFAAPAPSVQTGAGVPTGGLTPLSALAAAQRSALARAELESAYTETWRQAQAVFEE